MNCKECEYTITNRDEACSWPGPVTCKICKSKYPFSGGKLIAILMLFGMIALCVGSIVASSYYVVEENGVYRKSLVNIFLTFGVPIIVATLGVNYFGKVIKKYVLFGV